MQLLCPVTAGPRRAAAVDLHARAPQHRSVFASMLERLRAPLLQHYVLPAAARVSLTARGREIDGRCHAAILPYNNPGLHGVVFRSKARVVPPYPLRGLKEAVDAAS